MVQFVELIKWKEIFAENIFLKFWKYMPGCTIVKSSYAFAESTLLCVSAGKQRMGRVKELTSFGREEKLLDNINQHAAIAGLALTMHPPIMYYHKVVYAHIFGPSQFQF